MAPNGTREGAAPRGPSETASTTGAAGGADTGGGGEGRRGGREEANNRAKTLAKRRTEGKTSDAPAGTSRTHSTPSRRQATQSEKAGSAAGERTQPFFRSLQRTQARGTIPSGGTDSQSLAANAGRSRWRKADWRERGLDGWLARRTGGRCRTRGRDATRLGREDDRD